MRLIKNFLQIEQERQGINRFVHRNLYRLVNLLPFEVEHYLQSKLHILFRKPGIVRYKVPIDPFKVYWVDPTLITHFSGRVGAMKTWRQDLGQVLEGDWDLPSPKWLFTSNHPYLPLKSRFVDGLPWEEIMVDYLRDGTDQKRLHLLDALYSEISQNGYKSQKALIREKKIKRHFIFSLRQEILVDVGRDGQLLFVDNRHRLAIALILKLKAVPVVILARHKLWMEKLETIWMNREYHNHPDCSEMMRRMEKVLR